ncbi:phosphatase PAP2 family protein [Kocuria sp. M1R5S2]|uniref:phosphatase PAP2 family protein n=1 Tax=Kocuria rhizosphaerae TaxID=3376285 RepID=UPI003789B023
MALPAQHSSPRPARSTWSLPQLHQWVVVPFIVVLVTATIGRLLVYSPGVGAQESVVLQRLDAVRSGALDVPALALHHASSGPGVLVVVAAVTAWLARRRAWDAAGFAVTALSGWAAVSFVAMAVGRPQPGPSALLEPQVVVAGTTSFPSGHVGAALAVATALALAARRPGRGPAVLAAGLAVVALVGLSQVYLGAHYPLDVLAALPVAWAGVAIGCGLANRLVPALAWGFGWEQEGAGWAEDGASEAPAEEPAVEEPALDTARVPIVSRHPGHHAA